MARALLLGMNDPNGFWFEVILTACFLINRIPSKVLDFKNPFEVLYPNHLFSLLPPKIIGCTCFVHNFRPSHIKIDPKDLKCIFPGYSILRKSTRAIIHLEGSLLQWMYPLSIPYSFLVYLSSRVVFWSGRE